jgi:hypothetical protein
MLLHVEYQSQDTNTNKKLVFMPGDILHFKQLALWCDFRIQISSCHIDPKEYSYTEILCVVFCSCIWINIHI